MRSPQPRIDQPEGATQSFNNNSIEVELQDARISINSELHPSMPRTALYPSPISVLTESATDRLREQVMDIGKAPHIAMLEDSPRVCHSECSVYQ